MDRTRPLPSATSPAGFRAGLRAGLRRARKAVAMWQLRRFERRQLLTMDDHLLKDIGLSRADAWREAHKPFWRP